MIKTDEDALICDLAETYHVFDYRSLPVKTVATFSVGLRENSRIKMKMADTKHDLQTLLLSSILDSINLGNYLHTNKDESMRPESITRKLLGMIQEDGEQEKFVSPEEFERKRRELIEKGETCRV